MKTCPNCDELLGDSVRVCFNCNYDFFYNKVLTRQEVINNQIKEEEIRKKEEDQKKKIQIEKYSQFEKNPRFEYISVVIDDSTDGTINNSLLQAQLDKYADEGWRLHTVFTNEVNTSSIGMIGAGGIGASENTTIEQTILIFERCIKAGQI